MKRVSVAIALIFVSLLCSARGNEGKYQFTTVKCNPITVVKNQYQTGTCWDHACTAMMESEIIRINGITDPKEFPDLSEWFTVYKSYCDRVKKYIHLNGYMRTGPGSISGDFLHIVKDYGIVPESAMPCLSELPNHRAMDKALKEYMQTLVQDRSLLKGDWQSVFEGILKETLGECPEKFVVNGVEYTPASYRDAMGICPENYITFTSFTHFPLYEPAAIDVPDNWRWDTGYNVTIDDLVEIVYYAINEGYTVAWGMDLTEPGYYPDGLSVLPEGSDKVTQESRQKGFDELDTVDDHLMLIYGIALDKEGNTFFMVKDSQGVYGKYDGMRYVSEEYFRAKTIYLTLHKGGVPSAVYTRLQKKLLSEYKPYRAGQTRLL